MLKWQRLAVYEKKVSWKLTTDFPRCFFFETLNLDLKTPDYKMFFFSRHNKIIGALTHNKKILGIHKYTSLQKFLQIFSYYFFRYKSHWDLFS